MAKKVNNSVALNAGDNSLVTIPGNLVGELKRLSIKNPTSAERTIIVKDQFTPDASNGNPSPTQQTPERYNYPVPAGDWVDLDGSTIGKLLGAFIVNSDAANPVVSYVLEMS